MISRILGSLGLTCLLAVASPGQPPASPTPAAAAAPELFARTIYLVRHGIYDPTAKGNDDVVHALTPLGVAQARLVGDRLHGMPVTFSSLNSSTMLRARQTAMVVHESLPQLEVQYTPLLRECTPPTWREDIMKGEKAEELAAAEKQLNAAFAQFFVPATGGERHDILVCHGNVIRYFVTKALGVDPKAWLGFSIAHASLTVIQVTPKGAFRVFSVGDIGHIPPNMQSGATKNAVTELLAP